MEYIIISNCDQTVDKESDLVGQSLSDRFRYQFYRLLALIRVVS